ncbi:MAG: hypothetical protein ABIJ96_08225 [Elusimicrobiota bacterium]
MRILLLAVLALAGCKAPEAPADFASYAHPGGWFTAGIPRGWEVQQRGRETNPGIQVLAPAQVEGAVRHSIAIYFYRESHRKFPTIAQYLAEKALPIPGRSMTPVTSITVNGMAGKQFEATRPIPQIPELPPVEGELKSRSVLLQGDKGFYLFRYTSRLEEFDRYRETFEQVLKSLKPKA